MTVRVELFRYNAFIFPFGKAAALDDEDEGVDRRRPIVSRQAEPGDASAFDVISTALKDPKVHAFESEYCCMHGAAVARWC